MPNRVYGNKQCDKRFQRSGQRIAAQLAAPLRSQSRSTSFRDAVYDLVAESRACDGPEIEFCDDLAECELRPTLQLAVLFIVRELMLNAMYHSRSQQVLVGVAQDDVCLCVQVQDWGIGFDPTSVPPNPHGLEGIRDLVRWFAGTIEIDSQPGVGTCVIIELPLSQETGHPTTGLKPQRSNCELGQNWKGRSMTYEHQNVAAEADVSGTLPVLEPCEPVDNVALHKTKARER
jgi:two-component sensor histidine kinase